MGVMVLVMVMVIYGWMVSMVQCLLFAFWVWELALYARGIGPGLRSPHAVNAVMNDSSSTLVPVSATAHNTAVFAVCFLSSSPPSTVVFQSFRGARTRSPAPPVRTPRRDDAELCMQVQDAECRHRLQGSRGAGELVSSRADWPELTNLQRRPSNIWLEMDGTTSSRRSPSDEPKGHRPVCVEAEPRPAG